jgi:hypothetical protein
MRLRCGLRWLCLQRMRHLLLTQRGLIFLALLLLLILPLLRLLLVLPLVLLLLALLVLLLLLLLLRLYAIVVLRLLLLQFLRILLYMLLLRYACCSCRLEFPLCCYGWLALQCKAAKRQDTISVRAQAAAVAAPHSCGTLSGGCCAISGGRMQQHANHLGQKR